MLSLLDVNIEKLENISKMTLDDLRNPEVFSRLKDLVEEINTYYFIKEANYLLGYLVGLLNRYKELAQSDPLLFKDYQGLIVYLKFLTLVSEPINEVEELFRKHLLLAIQKKISLKERLRLIFLVNADEETGDKIRLAIIKALEANEEKIGKDNLQGGTDSVANYPYIKSWLRDYNALFSINRETRGEYEQATYLTQSKNVKKLNQTEKEILAGVIQLYDYLRFPEEEKSQVKATGHTPIKIPGSPKTKEINKIISRPVAEANRIREKRLEPQAKGEVEKNLIELKQLAASYPPGSLERKAVEEEINRATRNSQLVTRNANAELKS